LIISDLNQSCRAIGLFKWTEDFNIGRQSLKATSKNGSLLTPLGLSIFDFRITGIISLAQYKNVQSVAFLIK